MQDKAFRLPVNSDRDGFFIPIVLPLHLVPTFQPDIVRVIHAENGHLVFPVLRCCPGPFPGHFQGSFLFPGSVDKPGILNRGIPAAGAVILHQGEAAVGTVINPDLQNPGVRLMAGHVVPGQGQNAAGRNQHRNPTQGPIQGNGLAAPVHVAGKEIIVSSLRQPCLERRQQGFPIHGHRDGADKYLRPEPVFIGHLVGLGFVAAVIHRLHQRFSCLCRAVIQGVQVRNQPVAKPQEFRHDLPGLHAIVPGLLAIEPAVAAVQAHNG